MERLPVPRDMEVLTPEQLEARRAADTLIAREDAAAFLVGNRIIRLHEYGVEE